jgi:hypothetical protein
VRTLLNLLHSPRAWRLAALLTLVIIPNLVEAQTSGCTAVTYGCPTSGNEFSEEESSEALALMFFLLAIAGSIFFGGGGAGTWSWH